MDKRFLLALALTAVVVIATPWLFGPRARSSISPAVNTPPASVDSLRKSSANPRSPLPTSGLPEAIDSTSRVTTTPPTRDAIPVTVSVDTALISTPLAEYHFTSLGASPLAVKLKPYRALDGSE